MNNYCTNCGNKLSKNDLVCSKCGTPIIDIPDNYKTPEQRQRRTLILTIIGSILLCIILFNVVKNISNNVNVKNGEKLIKDFMEENYVGYHYEIEYDSSGKCIISGSCAHSAWQSCHSRCDEYEYLDEDQCTSYYFNVSVDGEEKTFTYVKKHDGDYVVEGKNIYGPVEEGDSDE